MEQSDRNACKHAILMAENEINMIKMEILGDSYISNEYLRDKMRALKLSINIIDNIINKEEKSHE